MRWLFHLRGSLGRVCDELTEHGIRVVLTTVLRWLKKAGEECVQTHRLCGEDWKQPLCIDEKWIKIRSRWNYVFTAVGTKVTDLLSIDLFHDKGTDTHLFRLLLINLLAETGA